MPVRPDGTPNDEDATLPLMRDVNLKAMEHFEAVARLGRVSKAAVELGVSPSAVSQQIRQIEAQFGVKLFRREQIGSARYAPTATRIASNP